jgi:hypothetical protein
MLSLHQSGQHQEKFMQSKYIQAVRLIVAVIVMGSQFALADVGTTTKSFEDGLTSSVPAAKEADSALNSEHHGSWKEIEDHMHVTMVPEPATDAMLLAGLAVLFVAARRGKVGKSL